MVSNTTIQQQKSKKQYNFMTIFTTKKNLVLSGITMDQDLGTP